MNYNICQSYSHQYNTLGQVFQFLFGQARQQVTISVCPTSSSCISSNKETPLERPRFHSGLLISSLLGAQGAIPHLSHHLFLRNNASFMYFRTNLLTRNIFKSYIYHVFPVERVSWFGARGQHRILSSKYLTLGFWESRCQVTLLFLKIHVRRRPIKRQFSTGCAGCRKFGGRWSLRGSPVRRLSSWYRFSIYRSEIQVGSSKSVLDQY